MDSSGASVEPGRSLRSALLAPLRRAALPVALRTLVLFAPFAVWQLAAIAVSNRLLPGPVEVVSALYEDIVNGTIWPHARDTFTLAWTGLAIAIVAGIAFGTLLARSRLIRATFEPLYAALYPVPKLALYPLLILAFGFGPGAKIAIVAIECAYPITYNVSAGIQGIDRHYIWIARNVEAGRAAMLVMMIRATLPAVMASLRIAAPISIVIILITEFMGESSGLGFLLRNAGSTFQPEQALAIVLLLGILGSFVDRLIFAATRKVAFWAPGVRL